MELSVAPGCPLRVSRRGVQLALAGLWLLDGALQCQPYMFTRDFADQVITPAGNGQPAVVSAPLHWAAQAIGAHPIGINAAFAAVQILLGLGLLWRRTVRVALAGSIGWGLGVWWLGEGAGGLASGHAMLLTGAPGAALLYAVLAAVAWPRPAESDTHRIQPSRWAVPAWVTVWSLGVVFDLLPGQRNATSIASGLSDSAAAVPHWLAAPGRSVAHVTDHHLGYLIVLIALQALIAAGALIGGSARRVSVAVGCTLAAAYWAFGQGFGQMFSGQATDPSTGPLLIVLGIAAVAAPAWRTRSPRAVSVSSTRSLTPLRRPATHLPAQRQPTPRAT